MGVQPSTLQTGLTAATASADTTRPTTSIIAPADGEAITGEHAYVIRARPPTSAAASAGVEVSVDGGATWRRPRARNSWTYQWITPASGTVTISVRATDDSGNVQTTLTSRTVTIAGTAPGVLVAAYGFHAGSGTAVADSSGRNNNGTHANAAWTAAGRNGGGMTFNGTSSLVTVPDSATLDLTNGMTLEAWVRPTALGTTWRTVMLKESGTNLAYALYAHDGSRPSPWIRPGNQDRFVVGTAALAPTRGRTSRRRMTAPRSASMSTARRSRPRTSPACCRCRPARCGSAATRSG